MSDQGLDLKRIHLIFKTHLDVGFTDFSAQVVANYFNSYIPRAIELAEALRLNGSPNRFVWTTGSWLIYEYLEQANRTERSRMENAIAHGDIVWHALPFTTHSEAMDPSLFRFGLGLSHDLDQRFGRRTIAAKMTDVPGHTRGIVPLLAEAGVQFLHIGVNGASTPPDVPPVFIWRDPDGAEVIVMYHKGSYGDLMIMPGLDEAIAFAHTGDNLGPQTVEELDQTYQNLRRRFPHAEVTGSTMDAFGARLVQIRDQLPILTQEIGDTWIHGIGTDPLKVAQFRELSRLRQEWLASGIAPQTIQGFSRKILLVPEHTWGLDVKTHLNDWDHYSAQEFRSARHRENFKKMEASWQEQRGYLQTAVETLPAELRKEAELRLSRLKPARPDPDTYDHLADPALENKFGPFTLAFDGQLGCLTRLDYLGLQLADPKHPLGKFWYETFSAEDYKRFHRQYNVNKRQTKFWAIPDFTKPGIDRAAPEHRIFLPRLKWAGQRIAGRQMQYLLLLEMPEESWQSFGAPQVLSLELTLDPQEALVSFRLQWFDKPACRLPEAAWFSFTPRVGRAGSWKLDKLGKWISPHEVIRNGNRHLHAVGTSGLFCESRETCLSIRTLDAALAAPGQPSLLNFNNRQPKMSEGVHFNLHNNLWGTNFPMWYEDDALFRFELQIQKKP